MRKEPVAAAIRLAKHSIFLAVIIFFVSCTSIAGDGYEVVSRETVDDQALVEVNKTATTFSVPVGKASNQAWDRARMFFVFFLKKDEAGTEPRYEAKDNWISNERIANQKYSYRIIRQDSGSSTNFMVKCIARPNKGGTAELAERNARNLSRFIQEGYLEVSLLDQ